VAANGGRVGWRSAECSINCLQNTLQIPVNIAIPEPENAKARARQCRVAPGISQRMSIDIMLTTVNLNHETVPQADKIDDVSLARRLSSEMISALTPRPQMIPDLHLLRR
jgi:hypothetical protein